MRKVKNDPKYKNAALQAIRAQFARCGIIKSNRYKTGG